ncbi:hypothetical protein [Streptomyces sp. V1I6]|uniref:hypothetical protein n=1 Tax=Streptomyces sp. V1I6 TaxID=3042273 RepID=UPI00278976A1|nr:hypothetical protein [Streptomyces sp. V1I6]MDQ0844039.1 hypothetical protein [Streptomyces sp. V1I6]
MGTIITVALIIAMIGLGMILIHRLNAQHGERIAAFHYSDALPGTGRSRGKNRRSAEPAGAPTVDAPEQGAGAADDIGPSRPGTAGTP